MAFIPNVKTPVSACVITYNEELHIDKCLSSIVNIFKEIIVVDSYSTDRTIEIAKKYTNKIYQREFDNFANQRNFALSKATQKYIFKIDADEYLNEHMQHCFWHIVQYDYPRDTNRIYKVKQDIIWMDKKLKHTQAAKHWVNVLWNNREAMEYNRSVHERIPEEGWETVKITAGKVTHNTYQGMNKLMYKIDQYSTLRAYDIAERKKKIKLVHLLWRPTYRFIRDYIIRGGFLDGIAGYIMAKRTCLEIYLRYVKAWRIQNGEEI